MNERIKELAKQATKEVWGNDPFNGAPTFEGHELDEEKFAELIVRECVRILIVGEGNDKTVDAIWDLEQLGIDVSEALDSIGDY